MNYNNLRVPSFSSFQKQAFSCSIYPAVTELQASSSASFALPPPPHLACASRSANDRQLLRRFLNQWHDGTPASCVRSIVRSALDVPPRARSLRLRSLFTFSFVVLVAIVVAVVFFDLCATLSVYRINQ